MNSKKIKVNNKNINPNDDKNVNNSESEIEKAFVEDPLFKFLKKWQNTIFWIIVLLVVGYFGFVKYKDVRLSEQKADADLFEEFRPVYANVIALQKDIKEKELEISEDEAKGEEEKKKDIEAKKKDLDNLKERLTKSLTEANARIKPLTVSKYYGKISKLYSAVLKKASGDIDGFNKEINEIGYNNYSNEEDESLRFYKELASIIVAKSYLEDTEKQNEAKELLKNLAKNGKYFNVIAYKTLQVILTSNESDVLASLKDEILAAYPEQSDLLKN